MIYLAAPYTHDDPLIVEERIKAVTSCAGYLITRGLPIYSPLTHNHIIATTLNLETGFDMWSDHDLHMLGKSDEIHILMLKGWSDSVGVAAEIYHAKALKMPVKYRQHNTPYTIVNLE